MMRRKRVRLLGGLLRIVNLRRKRNRGRLDHISEGVFCDLTFVGPGTCSRSIRRWRRVCTPRLTRCSPPVIQPRSTICRAYVTPKACSPSRSGFIRRRGVLCGARFATFPSAIMALTMRSQRYVRNQVSRGRICRLHDRAYGSQQRSENERSAREVKRNQREAVQAGM